MTLSPEELLQKHFPQFEKELIDFIAPQSQVKIFEPGELVMNTGQYFKSTMLIAEGNIKVYRNDKEGNEFFLYMLGAGEACALSLVCAMKNETSELKGQALEKTVVVLVPVKLMDELMQKFKSWYYFVLSTYRNRFEELLEVIDQVIFRNMDERLEFYLKNKTSKLGKKLSITHQEIANDLNSSREVITRLLKKMEEKKMLRLGRNQIDWLL